MGPTWVRHHQAPKGAANETDSHEREKAFSLESSQKSHEHSLRWNFAIPALCLALLRAQAVFGFPWERNANISDVKGKHTIKILAGLGAPECLNSKDWVTCGKTGSL